MERLEARWRDVARWARANPLAAALVGTIAVLLALALPPGSWTLLELFKLAASLSLPFALLFIGLRLERRKVANQELVRKRVAVYDYVAFRLNDILCFYSAVGDWAKMNPDTVIAAKREADRHMHVYRALFSGALFNAYKRFMRVCFEVFSDPQGGTPAKLKLDVDHLRRNMGPKFDETWLARVHFPPPPEAQNSIDAVRVAYVTLMREFAREIGVED